jgi:uncharacterized protein (DUF362 family)
MDQCGAKLNRSTVSISECKSYTLHEVQSAVEKSLEGIGGIQSFVKPGDTVLLKPNMLQAKSPEVFITTHPAVVEAVINIVKDAGAVPMLGDSPGGPARGMERFWEATGFYDVCKRTDTQLVNFEKSGIYEFERNGRTYRVARPVLDADVIINMPKIKTHGLTKFSCAVKNIYGVIPGLQKTEYHKLAPKPSDFAGIIVDVFALSKPHLNIIDGVIGMDGMGPSAGNPKEIGVVVASDDAVAVDSILCHYLGKDPMEVPTNRIAYEQGLGETSIENINVLGEFPIVDDFKWPLNVAGSIEVVPSFISRALMKLYYSRPAINPDLCTNCNTCVQSCPTDAILEKRPTPIFEYERCINCLCCMEMCPEKAVFDDKNSIYRFISRFSGSD